MEEGSDGAQDVRHECEVCDDKAWVDAWIAKFSEIEAAVSWVSESAEFDKEYNEVLRADLEYRMSIVLQHGEQTVRPASAQEYLRVRGLAQRYVGRGYISYTAVGFMWRCGQKLSGNLSCTSLHENRASQC